VSGSKINLAGVLKKAPFCDRLEVVNLYRLTNHCTDNSINMVLMRGEFAGVVEETTNQIIEKYVLETRGSMDVNQIAVVSFIGAISNVGAKVLTEGLEKFTAKTLSSQIKTLTSKEYKRYVRGFLKSFGLVKGGDRALNIAANTLISGVSAPFFKQLLLE